jgi:transcriptional regulator with XRE-family HTH domain
MVEENIMSISSVSFGKRLRALRSERGWSQQQLAQELDMGPAQIHRYEHGTSQPTLDVIRRIAILFRVSADELVFERGATGVASAHLRGELLQRFERVSQLPAADQQVVLYLLDAVLARAELTALAARQQPPPAHSR